MKTRTHFTAILSLAVCLIVLPSADAAKIKKLPNPDFTKGEKIPEGATKDWNLGATGCRGWIFSHKLETTQARQIYITKVAKSSPADGVLKVGDVILGIGTKAFDSDVRPAFGQALTAAESTAGGGKLELLRWRDGKTETVTVKLPVLGDYSATAPYNCAKSKKILEQGCEALAAKVGKADYEDNPISRSLNALALLASGNEKYLPILKKEAEWASNYSANKFCTWYYGYIISFLAEYKMVTGDESVMPGLQRLALESARGQSIVGSWGHKFAGEDGRLVGYGMMNAPGVPLTISMVLAREAGVKDKEVSDAIERSAKLLRFYIGKGAVPYGDHHPWIRSHEDNGKCGMAAVLFNLLEEPKGAEFFSRMSLAAYDGERDTGHTGNFWNIAWAMPGVNQSGPQATGAWMHEFGTWYYDFGRNYQCQFMHQGPPEATPDATGNWDATGAVLLAYAMPLKKIYLTGKKPATTKQLTAEEAKTIIEDGRGWNKNDPDKTYADVSVEELLNRLGSWSPVVRERAADALALRQSASIEPIVKLLDSPKLETRIGACQALGKFKERSAPAIPKLREVLKADDLWLRVKAAEAISLTGDAGRPVISELIDILVRKPSAEDPRGMEQRYMCFVIFDNFFAKSIDGVEREKLLSAIRAGLLNQDGRARASVSKVYEKLDKADIEKLMADLNQSVVVPSPSGIMFSDKSRMAGLKMMYDFKMEEGIDATLYWLTHQNHWGSKERTSELLTILKGYGANAKRTIPELEKLAADFDAGIPADFPKQTNKEKATDVRQAIQFLQKCEDKPELKKMNSKG